jgi:hypothetical protein
MLAQCKPKVALTPEEEEQKRYEETVAAVNEEIAQDLARQEAEKAASAKAAEKEAYTVKTDAKQDASPKRKHPTDSSILPIISRLLPEDYAEQAHVFETVTFSEPTHCGVCNGVLAGLWSQGKQCKTCGLIIHHGEGAGDHANCHAEAMVKPCPMEKQVESDEKAPSTTQSKKSTSTSAKAKPTADDTKTVQPSSNMLPGGITSLPAKIIASASSEEEHDKPHRFVEKTYASPTYCHICKGLLAGLWSQGFQCEVCGINVHRGEGTDGHDDCKAEALLAYCPLEKVEEEHVMTLGEAVKKSPNFFQEVKEQMSKDLMTHVKGAVIDAGVEGERSKNLARIRARVIPTTELLDAIAARGEVFSILVLLRLHVYVAMVASTVGLLLFVIALCPKLGFGLLDRSIWHLAVMHELTVLGTIHVLLVATAYLLRFYSILFKRKSVIIEEYLMDMFGINAEEDIGISVVGAAVRARAWSQRIMISASITCFTSLLAWHIIQPTLDELRRALSEDYLRAQNLLSEEL